MKRIAYIIVFALGTFLLMLPTRAETSQQVLRQIQAIYDKQDAALNRKDLKGALFHIDTSYVWRDADGSSESYRVYVKELSDWIAHKQTAVFDTNVQKVWLAGPHSVLVEAEHSMQFGVFDPKTKVAAEGDSDYTVHDKWVKRASGWMLIQSFVVGKAHKK